MMMKSVENSPQLYARLWGALYLLVILFGGFSEGFVTEKLIVAGNVTASAQNILDSPRLWNLGVAADFFVVVLAIPQLWIEYLFLSKINKSLMLLSFLLGAVSLGVEAVSKVFLLVILPILKSPDYLTAFNSHQIQVLSNLALRSHNVAFNIALVFFGFACLVSGYLIFKSSFLPKFIGLLLQFAGACYLVACFVALFAPALSSMLTPAILIPPLVGESALCLWLLVKGVNVEKWIEIMRRSERPVN
ncbi:DUF4386 domain-containing protein [Undibacterium sp. SXout11W]|uniref:DUF4386 domain-containing protein n=1 Tax=Undibacterium sp. SXout11W TaxID=3413050 RepID=UPI003BF189DA